MKRLVREYPQEAALLGVYFEEVAFYQAQENTRLEARAKQQGTGSGGGSKTRTNLGDLDFETEATIGGDDEVDWKDA